MRRRVWALIRMTDVLFSFQIGQPSALAAGWLVSGLPHNIDEGDLHPGTDQLPTELPQREVTAVTYLIAKTDITLIFGRVLQEFERPHNVPYERVLQLDRELRNAYGGIPEQIQVEELPPVSIDAAFSIASRIVLGNIFHKALCTVHSRYLKAAATDPQYLYSRLACVESAMTLLKFQAYQHQDHYHNGGVVRLTRYQTSLTTHDYFLAATMLCTALFLDQKAPAVPVTGPRRAEIMTALERSLSIFEDSIAESADARRVCVLLGSLLRELRPPMGASQDCAIGLAASSDLSCAPAWSQNAAGIKCCREDLSQVPASTYCGWWNVGNTGYAEDTAPQNQVRQHILPATKGFAKPLNASSTSTISPSSSTLRNQPRTSVASIHYRDRRTFILGSRLYASDRH